mmetsp:Transcript_18759/g.35745  ORF Transcript_18759/g.35745 Transcript_18759/m.35745 type:complete len:360 (-) Transcript_18759:254-1333(-)|eukprot:CAMPEP_0114245430 /NCGR_PEP_ID=MMETSP0058-20121206/11890_1 /TAXON_ID=36894 /ORGANISM="Pyramimonas parkeae, CCMP726" /LENGTH=359 /DNA_ID=CAMNT_0001358479 /DNA_START=107 /DNA_END=1186 /DNA_ORIENTATION=-
MVMHSKALAFLLWINPLLGMVHGVEIPAECTAELSTYVDSLDMSNASLATVYPTQATLSAICSACPYDALEAVLDPAGVVAARMCEHSQLPATLTLQKLLLRALCSKNDVQMCGVAAMTALEDPRVQKYITLDGILAGDLDTTSLAIAYTGDEDFRDAVPVLCAAFDGCCGPTLLGMSQAVVDATAEPPSCKGFDVSEIGSTIGFICTGMSTATCEGMAPLLSGVEPCSVKLSDPFVQACGQYDDQAADCQNICEKSLCSMYNEGADAKIDLDAGATMLYSLQTDDGVNVMNSTSTNIGNYQYLDDVIGMAGYCIEHLPPSPPPPSLINENPSGAAPTTKTLGAIFGFCMTIVSTALWL